MAEHDVLWELPYPRRRLETNLRSAIAARGLRHGWVAQQVGMTRTRIFRIIWGQAEPTRSERKKIADLLCSPADWLFEPDFNSRSWREFIGK